MSSPLSVTLAALIAAGHLPFLFLAIAQLRRGHLPATWLFGALGILVYYDLGFVLQTCGMQYQSVFFPQFVAAGDEDLLLLGLLVLASPYLLWLGARLTSPCRAVPVEAALVRFAPPMRVLFVLLILPVSIALAVFGVSAVWGAISIAAIKAEWISLLGGAYIACMLPMFATAFLVVSDFGRTRGGMLLVVTLVLCSMASTLFLGQRTMTLLPVLFLLLFYFRFRLRWLVLGLGLLLGLSAGTAWFYKGYAVRQDLAFEERLHQVINDDFTRANVLLRAIQESEWTGTRVLPFAGQGYVYATVFYVPRKWAPQKGHSTTAYFTGLASGQDTEFLSWGLGVGFLEQIALNFGLNWLVPGVLLYGMLLGALDKLRAHFPGTLVGVCLGAVWMSGYDASSVILYFGSMVGLAILLELIVGATAQPALVEPDEAGSWAMNYPWAAVPQGRATISPTVTR